VTDEQNVSRRRALLVLLLEHELERQTVWHNPQAVASLPFAAGMAFSSEYILAPVRSLSVSVSLSLCLSLTGQQAVWQAHVAVAWESSPRLAVHLMRRIGVAAVRAAVAQVPNLSPPLSPCTTPASVSAT
jgi:hypothetical protein